MKIKGFTLLEVLIAVTIIALAFVSLFTILTETIRNHDHLVEKGYATWVADSALNTYLVDTNTEKTLNGSTKMGNKTFDWEIRREPTPQAEVGILRVRVYEQEQLLLEMTGYEAINEQI